MPFQLLLPWLVMIPMLYGASLVGLELFLAFFVAALGLFAMHACQTICPQSEDTD